MSSSGEMCRDVGLGDGEDDDGLHGPLVEKSIHKRPSAVLATGSATSLRARAAETPSPPLSAAE